MAYFITKSEVKAAVFNRTIEDDKIQDDLIEACGVRYLMPILGEDFYDAVVATPSSYATLKTYLVPIVANYVKLHILPEIHAEISTAGVNQFTGQNKAPAGRNILAGLEQKCIDMAMLHASRLYKYLEDNTDSYPLYYSNANPQNKVKIAGGIVFDVERDEDLDDDYTINLRSW